jgi:hypothetical protein
MSVFSFPPQETEYLNQIIRELTLQAGRSIVLSPINQQDIPRAWQQVWEIVGQQVRENLLTNPDFGWGNKSYISIK